MHLNTYRDFIEIVNKYGFLALTNTINGLPSLHGLTNDDDWHTGKKNDPWVWRSMAAESKDLAYGCILNGYKGFISAEYYPHFYNIYHPQKSMLSRWNNGEIDQMTYNLYQLFDNNKSLSTSEVRKILLGKSKKGKSKLDSSLKCLQREFYLTVSEHKYKISKKGQPYGWPTAVFQKIFDALPEEYTMAIDKYDVNESTSTVLNRIRDIVDTSMQNEVINILGLNN